jgi:hypothetical protein
MNQQLSKGLIVAGIAWFLLQGGDVLASHSTWSELATPAGVGEVLSLAGGALMAVLGALGYNLPASKGKS